ncbi:MAG: DoxX family protein [bacterium]
MLPVFPHLLSLSSFAPFLLRIAAGSYILILAHENLENKWSERIRLFKVASLKPEWFFALLIASIKLTGGILLLAGASIQITSISLAILMLVTIFIKFKRPELISRDINIYILLFVILISLFFTGAGILAADHTF